MKKSLLALAALTAFAGAASAQSSVTLFGIVDLSVNSAKNGPNSLKQLSSDQMNSNRIGFRGIEDLGGGLRAAFWLEAGMAPDIGNAGGSNGLTAGAGQSTFFNRRATVALTGGFGEVRLGRDYDPTFNNRASFDPFGFNGIAQMGNVESTLGSGVVSQVRVNNAVSYFLPAMGGLYGQFQVAAGEAQPGQKYMGLRLGYAAGPINVGFATAKTYKTGTMTADYKQTNGGFSFNAGFMTAEIMYDKVDYGAANQKHVLLGVLVPFGAGTLKASYNKVSGSSDSVDAKLFGVGYQYDLSKRTALYATIARLTNSGNAATGAKFTIGQGPAMVAGGATSEGYNLGIRHSF
jgi:predicted porin